MPGDTFLDLLPLWALLPLTIILVQLSIEVGYRFGRRRLARDDHEKDASVGPMAAAVLGMLAFLLAFTFGMAASRFDDRRRLVLDEANAIGTAYLRAGLLPENHRDRLRPLLREYVHVRIEGVRANTLQAIARSEEIHQKLWDEAALAAREHSGSMIAALFVTSLNEVIDLHSKRVTVGLRARLPTSIWIALFVVSSLSMGALGYQSGLSASRRSPAAIIVALSFSIVICLVADLDRPQRGLLRVSQQSMIDLAESLDRGR